MITIYECEKCGEKFDEWKNCYDHESNHLGVQHIDSAVNYGGSKLFPEYAATIVVAMRDESKAVYVIDEDATNKLHMDQATEKELTAEVRYRCQRRY